MCNCCERLDNNIEFAISKTDQIESELETQFGDEGITNKRLNRIERILQFMGEAPESQHTIAAEIRAEFARAD